MRGSVSERPAKSLHANIHASEDTLGAEIDSLALIFRRSMLWTPERQAPSAWIEHVPFAFWLVDVLRPRRIVELGTQNGVSYSAMCQAVKALGLATSCFAIDTWKGDEHAGFYGEDVYSDFAAFHDQRYGAFSQLVRSSFDEALHHFEQQSIDLLHIDGLHIYEAVRHDYQSWLPKLSPNAVVLFHDTNVRERKFGVFQLWNEITAGKHHFSFLHGHGLGVLGLRRDYKGALGTLFDADENGRLVSSIRETFEVLGRSVQTLSEMPVLNRVLLERTSEISGLRQALAGREGQIAAVTRSLSEREARIVALNQLLIDSNSEISSLREAHAVLKDESSALRRELKEREVHIAELDHSLSGYAAEIGTLRHAYAAQEAKISSLETTISAVCASTSWRITAPLRTAMHLWRGHRSAQSKRLSRPVRLLIKQRLMRLIGLRIYGYLSRILAATRLFARRLDNLADVEKRDENAPDTYQEVYLTQAQHALGGHSRHYGARVSKSPPTERCDVKFVAYYLPQYHPIPENDRWWGTGFTEWRNVVRAFPVFAGHPQPRLPGELGFYDLRISDVMRQQIELAKLHGISAFCFHFYWFGGNRLLELPIQNFLHNTNLDFNFCLCWANENWSRRWDGADHEILIAQSHSAEDDIAFIRYLKRYFDDPRYLRIHGKPVLTVYRPDILPDAKGTVTRWRAEAERAGLPGLYLIATNSFGFSQYRKYGFDALSEFPPHGIESPRDDSIVPLHRDYRGKVYSYAGILDSIKAISQRGESATQQTIFPGVMPGWDNTPRRPLDGNVFHGSTPTLFYEWLMYSIVRARKNAKDERMVFINAWNEWAEGAYLEPDRMLGYAHLAACASAISGSVTVDPRVAALFKQQRESFQPRHKRAVAIHLYYEDLAEWFAQRVADFGDVDVYITVAQPIDWETAQAVKEQFNTAYILEVENSGRDIRPFLTIYPLFLERDYEFVCKLHSKKSMHLSEGDRWREDMVGQLLSASARDCLAGSGLKSIGILAPRGSLESLVNPSIRLRSEQNLIMLASRLNCEITFTESFVAGSMFWFRPSALRRLHELLQQGLEFEPELGQVDGTIAHAIERIVCIAAKAAGMSTREFGETRINRPSQWR